MHNVMYVKFKNSLMNRVPICCIECGIYGGLGIFLIYIFNKIRANLIIHHYNTGNEDDT